MRTKYNDPAPSGYISINELAMILPKSNKNTPLVHRRRVVYAMLKRGDCPYHIKIGMRTFFELNSVTEWIARKKKA